MQGPLDHMLSKEVLWEAMFGVLVDLTHRLPDARMTTLAAPSSVIFCTLKLSAASGMQKMLLLSSHTYCSRIQCDAMARMRACITSQTAVATFK